MVENFPSLLSELSEQESAGGQLFSLAKRGGGGEREREEGVCVCWGEGGGVKRQLTIHPVASEGEPAH